jgi:hypothetical protein
MLVDPVELFERDEVVSKRFGWFGGVEFVNVAAAVVVVELAEEAEAVQF